jgi:hypothetical protein
MGNRLTAHPRKGGQCTGVQMCMPTPHTHPYMGCGGGLCRQPRRMWSKGTFRIRGRRPGSKTKSVSEEDDEMRAQIAYYDSMDDLARTTAAAVALQQGKNDACEKRFVNRGISEDSVRCLSDEDVWRLLDNRQRPHMRCSQGDSLHASDPEAQDNACGNVRF